MSGKASRKVNRRVSQSKIQNLESKIAGVVVAVALCQIAFVWAWQNTLAEHYTRRAQRAVGLNEFKQAAVWAERALALNPRQGYAAFFAGTVQQRNGQFDQAAKSFARALCTMAHRGRALRELAESEEKLGSGKAAIAHFAQALAIEPLAPGDTASPWARWGQMLFAQEQWGEGLARFRAVLADVPESRYLFDGLAVGYEAIGVGDAAVACAAALLLSPRHVTVACKHFGRLAESPSLRPLIRDILAAAAAVHQPGTPSRATIDQLLCNLPPAKTE